jgi:hypothetical protein
VLVLDHIATLDIAAASGLVLLGDELAVIADDELSLSRYRADGHPLGRLPLFPGSLPDDPPARKRAKPDLEALAALPDGRLLALGSGSTPSRDRAALITGAAVAVIDLAPLYTELRERLVPLNIEGACASDRDLVLLNRRIGRAGQSVLVRLDLDRLMAALDRRPARLDASLVAGVSQVDLGAIGGTPLGFTDATPWRGGILFAAAAEVTDDPVLDGACVAAELGWLDASGAVLWRARVAPCVKLEGIAVRGDRDLLAVADSDDRALPAPLFAAELPLP